MNILVGGSLRDITGDRAAGEDFVRELGRQVVRKGHVLLNGCRSSLDEVIATAAAEWLSDTGQDAAEQKRDPKDLIIAYCSRDHPPAHNIGSIRRSSLPDWNMNHPELKVPEQIALADATFFVGGSDGTFWAKNWAYYARKPILGIPRFGGAGETIYEMERERLRRDAPAAGNDYETLNQMSGDVTVYAHEAVSLAERLASPRTVFTIMSFKKDYHEVFRSCKEACKRFDFDAIRTDESLSFERLTTQIEKGIQDSAFVLADVSEPSMNVFYEVGSARGLGKKVVMCAKRGAPRAFDTADIPTIEWSSQKELKEGLTKWIAGIKGTYGR
jgi:hypothetical protein